MFNNKKHIEISVSDEKTRLKTLKDSYLKFLETENLSKICFFKKMLRNTQQNGMKQRLFIIYSDKAISNLSYRKAKE